MDVTTNPLPEPSGTAPPRSVTSDPESVHWMPFLVFLKEIRLCCLKSLRTMEQNVKKDELEDKFIQGDCNLNCRQHLISLFGESTAEYFLSPSSRSKDKPLWFFQLQDDMRDHMSAEALWDALGERSTQILQESNTEASMIARRVVDWKTLKKQDHLKHLSGVRHMFRSAQRNQAISALLLQRNPRFNPEINNEP